MKDNEQDNIPNEPKPADRFTIDERFNFSLPESGQPGVVA